MNFLHSILFDIINVVFIQALKYLHSRKISYNSTPIYMSFTGTKKYSIRLMFKSLFLAADLSKILISKHIYHINIKNIKVKFLWTRY